MSEDMEWKGLVGDVSHIKTELEMTDINVLLLLSSRCVVATVGNYGVYSVTTALQMPVETVKALATSTPIQPIAAAAYGAMQWDYELGMLACVRLICDVAWACFSILHWVSRWFSVCFGKAKVKGSFFRLVLSVCRICVNQHLLLTRSDKTWVRRRSRCSAWHFPRCPFRPCLCW
jgi:hypothetical protein